MDKKMLSLALLSFLLLTESVPFALAHPPNPTDTTHLIIDTVLEPETLDPAWANNVGSHEVIMNVYEPLLFFDRNYRLGPYAAGMVDQFVPKLATSWIEQNISETSPEGLTWVKRWTFTMRTGVKFHDGSFLTPEDVEYSFERSLVQDGTGGPSWMLYEPLLGVNRAADPTTDSNWGLKIDHAIERNATTVWFNLVRGFPSVMFKQILSQTWSGVVKKGWAVSQGDFDGNWAAGWQTIWNTWHDPAISFIYDRMMGTGPYKFDYWVYGASWSIVRFADYWDGWPAKKSEAGTERIGGYIERVTWNYLASWMTRRMRFLAGDSDLSYIDRQYRDQILGANGIRSFYRWEPQPDENTLGDSSKLADSSTSDITYSFPLLALDAFFFNFNIDATSAYVGNLKPPGTFGEDGIPPDIFSDINVRRGFAYAFNYPLWFASQYLSEGNVPTDPVIKGLPYDNPAQEGYSSDSALAAYYLRLAWGGIDNNPPGGKDPLMVEPGALWNNGMKFSIVFPTGSTARETAASMLANSVNSLNSRFHIDYWQAPWGSMFLPQMVNGQLPLFVTGMQGGFPDPHDFVHPFMHSQGVFAASQRYNNPTANSLIEAGINTPDGSSRQQIYYQLQALYHDDVPSVPLVQPSGREWERDWMRGWYYNPVYQGHYVYHLWKARTHFGDANNDGAVGVVDSAYISAHWTSPTGGGNYNPAADLTGGEGGTTGSSYGPVPGIPDGKVDILDKSMVSAYWG